MKYAILADVHGNLPALEAVEADFRSQGAEAVIHLGDAVSGPLWPRETAEAFLSRNWHHVRGNHDRAVSTSDPQGLGPSDAYAHQCLDEGHRAWVAAMPFQIVLENSLWAFHGSPASDDKFLLEEVAGSRLVLRPLAEIEQALASVQQDVVLCGHSHLARHVRLTSGTQVVNPGSVGLQAYAETGASSYRVENGSPHARYALLEQTEVGWQVTFRVVAYDWHSASRKAGEAGRPDWQIALATGFCGFLKDPKST
jgi:predicted phosphodiesterase